MTQEEFQRRLGAQLCIQLDHLFWGRLWSRLRNRLWDRLWPQLRTQLYVRLREISE